MEEGDQWNPKAANEVNPRKVNHEPIIYTDEFMELLRPMCHSVLLNLQYKHCKN